MNNINMLTTLEYKRILKKKGIYIGLIIATLYALMIAIQAINNQTQYNSVYIHSFFSNIAAIVILIYGANILSEDFKYGTVNTIFTKGHARYQVVLAKLMCIVMLGVTFGIVDYIYFMMGKIALGETVTVLILFQVGIKVLGLFVVYSFCIGAFGIMVSIISFNSRIALITSFICFWVLTNSFDLVATQFPEYYNIIKLIPFYSVTTTLTFYRSDMMIIGSIIIYGVLFLTIGISILEHKDLK